MTIKKNRITAAVDAVTDTASKQPPVAFPDHRPYQVYVSRTGNCVYAMLEHYGAPRLATAHFLPGSNLGDKITRWVAQHWTTQVHIMRWMAGIVQRWNKGEKVSVPVANKASQVVMSSILDYMYKNLETLSQLTSLFGGQTTLAGTPVPELSKAFDHMSFPERQAILRANLQKVEPVPED